MKLAKLLLAGLCLMASTLASAGVQCEVAR